MRFKDMHYPEIIKNLHFAKLHNGNLAEAHKMGDLNELFILDNLTSMQEHGLIPKKVDIAEYEFINERLIFPNHEFFFTRENDFVMVDKKKEEYFVLRVKQC
jgi:hypothetical protein